MKKDDTKMQDDLIEKNKIIETEDENKDVIEASKDSLFKDNNSKVKISIPRTIRMGWGLWRMIKKAKKISKRISRDPNSFSEEYRYNFMKKSARRVLKWLNIQIDVVDIHNWLDKGVILAPNHQSNVDPIIIMAINNFMLQQPVAYISKKEMFSHKIGKHFLNLIDVVSIDRNSPRSALNAFKEAKEMIVDYKRSMVLFPEGTRSKSQQMNEFLPASLKLAQMAYAPVIPVSIIDSYKISDSNRPKVLRIKVIFGKPLLPEKFISIKAENLTNNVKKEVQKNIDQFENWDRTKQKPKLVDKKNRCTFY